jgi:hypothetical protein
MNAQTGGTTTTPTADGDSHGDEGTPSASTPAEAGNGDHPNGEAHQGSEHSERVFGINPEWTPLVTAAVIGSLLLALALLLIGSPLLAAAVAVATVAFAGLDIKEVAHQIDLSHPGIAGLAAAVALLHLLAASTCVLLALRAGRRPTPTIPAGHQIEPTRNATRTAPRGETG